MYKLYIYNSCVRNISCLVLVLGLISPFAFLPDVLLCMSAFFFSPKRNSPSISQLNFSSTPCQLWIVAARKIKKVSIKKKIKLIEFIYFSKGNF